VQTKDFESATDLPLQVKIAFDHKAPALAENLAQELAAGSEFARGIRDLANLVTGESTSRAQHGWWGRLVGAGA
jgi:Flp pilus assembly CpaE family ATPase